jgi:nitrite reductase/ring-hydroxylating ferredoxin subunit
MAPDPRLICASSALEDGGEGVRFSLPGPEGELQAFVVRHKGVAHAYLNRCAHRPVELDWLPGRFFDADQRYLICATHGALFEPADGLCVAGPCHGGRLVPVSVFEQDGQVFWHAP